MKLAINGGRPIRERINHPFPNTDERDIRAVLSCFKRNSFSAFRAGSYEGGTKIKALEEHTRSLFGVEHAVAFDTWSNGIIAGLMAIGVEAGDEVIVPPYTMTSCATSILACGAVPVFADVCLDSGCIDPLDIERKITPRTKAIFVVHLFGIPAHMSPIMSLAKKHGLYVFEDCAQAPLAQYMNRTCGTIGDISGISLTESKHVMSGEGGIALTDNVAINNGLRIIRNHGEACRSASSQEKYAVEVIPTSGLIGFNFRMTELCAALAQSQLEKINEVLLTKRKLADSLINEISKLEFIQPLIPSYDHTPSWYSLPFRFSAQIAGIPRERFVAALNAEGMNFSCGYVEPLYYQSIYRSTPHWVIKKYASHINYHEVKCPNVEKLWKEELITTLDIRPPFTLNDMNDVIKAFKKVTENIGELR